MTNETDQTDHALHGAALRAAAEKRARDTGYAVVIHESPGRARRIMPDGSYQIGRDGDYQFCLNFGPGSE